ncbi:MAG: hypothetical protein GTO18_08340 [Anaerolineales bacterium]|nr:hypothetical protein [Anaerolineales bacterium]
MSSHIGIDKLRIHQRQLDMIQNHIQSCIPEEACGFLAGIGTNVIEVIPVTNELHSPVRFRMEPMEQLAAMERMEELGYEMLGIYHSHVHGPSGLSETDLAEAAYPDTAYLVCTPGVEEWEFRAFRVKRGQVMEIPILLLE